MIGTKNGVHVIAGTNLPVSYVLHLLRHYSVAGVLWQHPELTETDISHCIAYALHHLPSRSSSLPAPEQFTLPPSIGIMPERAEQTGE